MGDDKNHPLTKALPKQLQKHPLFLDPDPDFKSSHGLDISQEKRIQLKAIFAIANYDMSGVIGRKQFTDLMTMLGIEPSDEELAAMMLEMDSSGDGIVEFDEFVVGMVHNYDDALIAAAALTPIGTMGTKRWARGEILWCLNSNVIVLCKQIPTVLVRFIIHEETHPPNAGLDNRLSSLITAVLTGLAIVTTVLVYFAFILVPLTLAYFITFLLVPLMNVFEKRPMKCGKKEICGLKENAKRYVITTHPTMHHWPRD